MDYDDEEGVNPMEMLKKLLGGEGEGIILGGMKKSDPLEEEQNPEKFLASVEFTDPVALDTLRQKEEVQTEGRKLVSQLELLKKKHEYLKERLFDELRTAYPKVGKHRRTGYRNYGGKLYFVGWGKEDK